VGPFTGHVSLPSGHDELLGSKTASPLAASPLATNNSMVECNDGEEKLAGGIAPRIQLVAGFAVMEAERERLAQDKRVLVKKKTKQAWMWVCDGLDAMDKTDLCLLLVRDGLGNAKLARMKKAKSSFRRSKRHLAAIVHANENSSGSDEDASESSSDSDQDNSDVSTSIKMEDVSDSGAGKLKAT
jgi:hypothetical protein